MLTTIFFRIISRVRSSDWLLNLAVFTLMLIGFSAIYSIALSQDAGDFSIVKKQLVAAVIGIAFFVWISSANYRLLRNYAKIFYVSGLILLGSVLIFGSTIRGTTGWFKILGFQFQPVEFMKIALIITLAAYFSRFSGRLAGVKQIIESGIITAFPVVLTMLQPDFGSAMMLLSIWGVLLLFAGLQKKHLLALAGCFLLLSALSWQFFLVDYQKSRIMTFLQPTADPLGQGYNVNQAIIAIGSGGWIGRGLGFGSQSQLKFLPESQTDFIFAVIAEELGFVGVCIVFFAFGTLFFRMYRQATDTTDDFTGYLVVGVGTLIFVQFSVNSGMNLGLLPVTGLGLPLVSYGGSSLIVMLTMLGIVQSAAIHNRTSWHRTQYEN